MFSQFELVSNDDFADSSRRRVRSKIFIRSLLVFCLGFSSYPHVVFPLLRCVGYVDTASREVLAHFTRQPIAPMIEVNRVTPSNIPLSGRIQCAYVPCANICRIVAAKQLFPFVFSVFAFVFVARISLVDDLNDLAPIPAGRDSPCL